MTTFAFRAVDVAGVPSKGEVDATSKGQVTEQLRQRGLIVLDVSEQRDALKLEALVERFQKVKMRDLAVFSRQFATLIGSGMPMLRSLYTLEEQTEDKKIQEAAAGVRADVEAGSSVAQAMERHPAVFDPLYRSMVRAGEGSGRLESALEMVAFQLEKLDALRRQVRSAMMYPSLVLGFAVVAMIGDRRLHRPRVRRHLRGDRRRAAGGELRASVHVPDHGQHLRRADRLLVHHHRRRHCDRDRLQPVEEDRAAGAISGTL